MMPELDYMLKLWVFMCVSVLTIALMGNVMKLDF